MYLYHKLIRPVYLLTVIVVILASCQKSPQSVIPIKVKESDDPPAITSISPDSGDGDATVTIKGSNFNTDPLADTVKFYGVKAVVKSATQTSLTVVVPQNGLSGAVTVATSKGLATGPNFNYPHTVYATGYQRTANLNGLVMLWKNGIPTPITGDNSYGYGQGLAVVDTDVYISGWEQSSASIMVARYWKNGVEHTLYEGGTAWSEGNAIAVSGADVYVAGYQTTDIYNSEYAVKYWKNGTGVTLNETNQNAGAYSIFVSGNDVYTAGYFRTPASPYWVATYWKNGNQVEIPSKNFGAYGTATSIFVSGDDVYIAWNELYGVSTAKLWKNGTTVNLTDGTNDAAVNCVVVVGNDVYVAGYESNGTHKVAKYWKNGAPVLLSDGTTDAAANSISVVGKDVYVGGYQSDAAGTFLGQPDKYYVGMIWKNGTPFRLNSPGAPAIVNAIVAK